MVELRYTETQLPSQTPDPAATYVYILNRLRISRITGQKLSPAEGTECFRQLMYACESLIRENERLRTQLSISDSIVTDLEVDLLMKDLDILSLTPPDPKKEENG